MYRPTNNKDESIMQHSVKTRLATAQGAFGREFNLVHRTAGIVPAGSGQREIYEQWAVETVLNNMRGGQAFKTLTEAQAYFDQYTTPITEQK